MSCYQFQRIITLLEERGIKHTHDSKEYVHFRIVDIDFTIYVDPKSSCFCEITEAISPFGNNLDNFLTSFSTEEEFETFLKNTNYASCVNSLRSILDILYLHDNLISNITVFNDSDNGLYDQFAFTLTTVHGNMFRINGATALGIRGNDKPFCVLNCIPTTDKNDMSVDLKDDSRIWISNTQKFAEYILNKLELDWTY